MTGASARPPARRWSWVQFTCASLFFGVVAFLHIEPPLDGLAPHLLKTLVTAGVLGGLAGRYGDWVWEGIGRWLWFW